MAVKLPYYMVYPMPLVYDDERTLRRDYEYMKSLYPETAKKILPYIEEECDRFEKPCSMMYDEYPDKIQLRLMSSRILENVRANEKGIRMSSEKRHSERTDWLRDLVEVMLYQELYKRRSDDRRMRRRFY